MSDILPFPHHDNSTCDGSSCTDWQHAARHPISRWYIVPLVGVLADRMAETRWRPAHVTLLGVAMIALATFTTASGFPQWGALLVWLAWICDRLDGRLARTQESSSRWGAWLDANVDEAGDIVLHAACAACVATAYSAMWPWILFAVFLGGKYLWQYGIRLEEQLTVSCQSQPDNANGQFSSDTVRAADDVPRQPVRFDRVRRLYNLPGNADLRVHLLIGALALARPEIALAFAAAYFGLRTTVRSFLVWRRLNQDESQPADASSLLADEHGSSSAREAA
ncbi:MAG: CDP-alcohol phosphatidyltransferase family protein [Pirellulales bacterium]|nr:CDP-alcohol phosphatidyltransferase family protein [Pirellulales bacterium]